MALQVGTLDRRMLLLLAGALAVDFDCAVRRL